MKNWLMEDKKIGKVQMKQTHQNPKGSEAILVL